MAPKSRPASRALAPLRAAMDRVNERLLRMLERRARLAVRIARAKAARGVAVRDPGREARMLRAVVAAAGDDLGTDDLTRIFEAIFRGCRRAAEKRVGSPGRR